MLGSTLRLCIIALGVQACSAGKFVLSEAELYSEVAAEDHASETEGESPHLELLQEQAKLVNEKKIKTEHSTVLGASSLSFTACAAEFIAMTLFVVIGCGSAMGIAKVEGSAWILQVSLTFGFAITSLAYAVGHYSGGQINCAVTLGLWIAGELPILQAVCNFVAQMLGSVFGAFLLTLMYPAEVDQTGALASNGVSPNHTWTNALIGEILMTFLLIYVVLETAKNPLAKDNSALACVAIGFAVFLAHSVLIPIDGCSINPTRSFGPEIVARMMRGKKDSADHIVFWIGPLAGAAIAAGIYRAMKG